MEGGTAYRICRGCTYFSAEAEAEAYCPACALPLVVECDRCGLPIRNPYALGCTACGHLHRVKDAALSPGGVTFDDHSGGYEP